MANLPTPLKYLKKGVVLVMGSTVVLLGIIMLVTPGPGLVVIPAGLAILAIEFAWAKKLLGKFPVVLEKCKQRWSDWKNKRVIKS